MTRFSAQSTVRRRFTLMEIIVVLTLMAVICGIVLPRIGRLPEGLRIKNCIGTFENVFRDAALRANATGATVKVKLNVAEEQFDLEEAAAPPLPPVAAAPTGFGSTLGSSSRTSPTSKAPSPDEAPAESRYSGGKSYNIPNGIEWKLENWDAGMYGTPSYTFFPNGEATGPELEFDAGNRRLRLDVDRLTGRPIVTEIEN